MSDEVRCVKFTLTAEKTMQPTPKLKPTNLLELRDKTELGIVGGGGTTNEALAEPGSVVSLEDVLFIDIIEQFNLGVCG